MSEADGKLIIDTTINTKDFDAQIGYLENKLNDLLADYETLSQEDGFNEQSNEAIKLRQEIEKTSNQIVNLRNQQAKLEQTSTKSWGKILHNLKKVGLRMFGIASAYGIISKASRSYLSQDTELAEKLQSVWVALGTFLTPVIEGISNVLLKAVGYINEFVKALTGIDFIAKANAKAIEKQTKATKELNKANKQTYDFDVIRTQQEQSSASSGTSAVSGLIQIPELNEAIVNKLKNLAYWLKENETWIKAVGIALAATFGALAIAKLVKGISTLIGSGAMATGLSGLGTILAALAGVVLITITVKGIMEAIEAVNNLKKALDSNKEIIDKNKDAIDKFAEKLLELENEGKDTTQTVEDFTNVLLLNTNTAKDQIKALEKDKTLVGEFTGENKKLNEVQEKQLELIRKANEKYKELFEQGKLTNEQKNKYKESLDNEIQATKTLGGEVENLEKQYQKIDGQAYTSIIQIDADTSKAEKKLSLLDKFKEGWSKLFTGLFGGGGGGTRFAQGGIVTQPTRAIIGEAGYPEAVVPMTDDYLSTLAQLIGQYGGGSNGGGVTNVYLDGRLIQRQVSNRESEVRFATNK